MRLLISFLSAFILFTAIDAQDTTRTHRSKIAAGYITSGVLITTGIILNKESTKRGFRDWVRERYTIPNTNVDDVLQHSPIAMIYIADLALGQKKNVIARHTRHLIVTQALTLGTTFALKNIINSTRPNGGMLSFPSGHTAYSFASAGVMYQSFKKHNKWLAYSGYIPATIVGAYRMIKDKHWISDVFVGAGLGILMSHLSYHLDIWHSRSDKDKEKSSSVNISLAMSATGVGMSATF